MGWKFWAGVGLMVGGCVLMAWPPKVCFDCDDEVTNEATPIYTGDQMMDDDDSTIND